MIELQSQEMQKRAKELWERQSEQLTRFYHLARNSLVVNAVELIECKNILVVSQNEERVKSINSCIAKGEELLEIFKGSL
jgi:hypothetical protein